MNYQNLFLVSSTVVSIMCLLLIITIQIRKLQIDEMLIKYLSNKETKFRKKDNKIYKVPYGSIVFNEKLFINLDEIYKIEFGKKENEKGSEYSLIFNYKNGNVETMYFKDLFIRIPTKMDEANKAIHAFKLFKAIVKIKSLRDFYFDRKIFVSDDEYDCIYDSIYDVTVYKDGIDYEKIS